MLEPGKEYYTAFAQLQMALTPIKKSKTGHNWTYASIDDIWAIVLPLLDQYGFTIESSRKQLNTQMVLCTRLIHIPSLQGVEDVSPLMAYHSSAYDDQEAGENVTYQRRYALMVLLNLQMQEDGIEKRPRIQQKAHHGGRPTPSTIAAHKADALKTLLFSIAQGATLEKHILAFNKVDTFEQLTEDQYLRALTYVKDNSQ